VTVEPPDPDTVTTLEDFISYIEELAQHFKREHERDDWQHWQIGHYLEAMAAWLRATPGLPDARAERGREIEQERPTWRGVANLFDAARVYE
jgi:hypothetical protein